MAESVHTAAALGPYASTAKVPAAQPKGAEKAAVLLVSLGMDRAAQVLAHLSEDEMEAASLRMAQLRNVPPATIEMVMREFVETVQTSDSLASGGIDFANEVLVRALGPDVAATMIGRVASIFEKRPFEFLRHTPASRIARVLLDESPQTKALVVANLPTVLAAEVLSELGAEDQSEVALRVALMDDVTPETLSQVEDAMRRKFACTLEPEAPVIGGAVSLAEILSHTAQSTERSVLDSLDAYDSELAAEVRRLLFTFDDLTKLDDRAIQLVLREADGHDLSLALRGVNSELKHRILCNMSERGGHMLLEEIEYQGPQRKRFIEEAQGRIVAIVRRLEDAGLLLVPRDHEDVV